MNTLRHLIPVALLSLSVATVAQSNAHHPADQPAPSDAQKSFTELKTLSGSWLGPVKVDPPMPEMGNKPTRITLRVTSRGNALVHEMKEDGAPEDPTKYDDPITMLYLENDKLFLTHYCDAGNRPRMLAKPSPDGKTIDFDFVDLSGSTKYGHMMHARFTVIDANHHLEDWTYMMPGDKPIHAHFDLQRAQ